MLSFLLAALLSIPAAAQEAGQFNSACFLGLVDADTPATLDPCNSPDLLNTESNLQGTAILKRKGFSKVADLTIATSAVSGSHSFIDSSGNRLDIVCHDRFCAKSTNGNAFANFLSTAGSAGSVPKRWSFVDVGGVLYGANDKRDLVMRYDGTTRTSAVGIPQGSILELTQDRLAVGDISGQPNRVHYSSAGAFEQFTLGVNPEDSFFDEIGAAGDRVRGIKCIGGNCFIFKTASITLCEMANQYNTQCSVISPVIGTTDPSSIVAAGSSLYFRAQDKNYWEISPSGLRQISKKIPNLVKSQSGGLGGGENTNTQTTQADWQAGTQRPSGSWDTVTTNGSIFPSSATLGDSTSSHFSLGTLVNTSAGDTVGVVLLSTNSAKDNFSNGDFTVGPTTWTAVQPSGFSIGTIESVKYLTVSGVTNSNDNIIYTTRVPISSGSWTMVHYTQGTCAAGGSNCVRYKFFKIGNGDYYNLVIYADTGGGTPVHIEKNVSGTPTTIASTVISLSYSTDHTYVITRNASGNIQVSVDSLPISALSVTDTDVSGDPVMTEIALSNTNSQNYLRGLSWYQYKPNGTFTSQIFDTAYSTPTWGQFSSTYTAYNALGEGNIAFYVQSSTANDGGGMTSVVSTSDTLRPSSLAQKRYWRYRADFSSSISTKSPSLDAASLGAATTGQFITQCLEPNSSISAWGTLSCAETKSGAGSLVYYATSAATCAALPTQDPVDATKWPAGVITNNATLSIATNTAVKFAWRSLIGSSTDQAQVDACVLSWNEGTPSQPSWAAYDSITNSIFWTATVGGASYTNRFLKYDRNLEQWYPFDIRAQAPRVINNQIYFGGASSGTWNLYGLVDADDGGAINAYWKSKDVGSETPFKQKDFKTLSMLTRNNLSGSMTSTWTNSIGITGSYTVSLSTGPGITYARSNFNLPKQSPQSFMNVRFGSNSAVPFEVLGFGLTWETKPWKVEP